MQQIRPADINLIPVKGRKRLVTVIAVSSPGQIPALGVVDGKRRISIPVGQIKAATEAETGHAFDNPQQLFEIMQQRVRVTEAAASSSTPEANSSGLQDGSKKRKGCLKPFAYSFAAVVGLLFLVGMCSDGSEQVAKTKALGDPAPDNLQQAVMSSPSPHQKVQTVPSVHLPAATPAPSIVMANITQIIARDATGIDALPARADDVQRLLHNLGRLQEFRDQADHILPVQQRAQQDLAAANGEAPAVVNEIDAELRKSLSSWAPLDITVSGGGRVLNIILPQDQITDQIGNAVTGVGLCFHAYNYPGTLGKWQRACVLNKFAAQGVAFDEPEIACMVSGGQKSPQAELTRATFQRSVIPGSQLCFGSENDTEQRQRIIESTKRVEQAACLKNVKCIGKKILSDINYACKKSVERHAKYQVEWEDGMFSPAFQPYKFGDKPGTLMFIGDKAKFQNQFGAWQKVEVYVCLVDIESKQVLESAVTLRE